jgi:glycosyltransferase involved in cell wall biosynthesis
VQDPELNSERDLAKLGDIAGDAGLRRIHMLAWRDLDDPEAGGSEIHAATIAALWARAGLEVTMRTSSAAGHPPVAWRDGYRVIRRAGRYLVFPRASWSEATGRHGERDGLIEIWNGMPFFSPLWATGPRIVFLHHLHAEMWDMTLPSHLASIGRAVEARLAPPIYRRTRIVTLSESSRNELIEDMGFRPNLVTVVPPGIDPQFSPAGRRSRTPLVAAVGRLVPVKRFDLLIDALVEVRRRHPGLEAVIVGEGYERDALERRIRAAHSEDWLRLPGRLRDDELVALYRRAWVLASASAREGWGMTITEAAACGTPAVATRIAGHLDAVADDESGLLVGDPREITDALDRVIGDAELRKRLRTGARRHAAQFTWAATARGTLEALADDARRRRGR